MSIKSRRKVIAQRTLVVFGFGSIVIGLVVLLGKNAELTEKYTNLVVKNNDLTKDYMTLVETTLFSNDHLKTALTDDHEMEELMALEAAVNQS